MQFVEHKYPFSTLNLYVPVSSLLDDWYPISLPVLNSYPNTSQSNDSVPSPLLSQEASPSHPTPPSPPPHPPSSAPQLTRTTITRLQNNIRKPIQKLNLNAQVFDVNIEPKTVAQALKIPV